MRDRSSQGLAAITLLAAALRFPTLDVQSFWLDEAVTVMLIDQSPGEMLGEVSDREATPPLYYLLAWLWAQVFGLGEVGLRSLSALLGTVTVPVVYAAGRALVSRRAGLLAAALAATNPLLVWYSQEARSYGLLVLLVALSLWFFARALEEGRRSHVAAWALVGALALATHYFALFVVVPEAVWLIVALRPRVPALAAAAAPAAAGLALLPLALHQRSGNPAAFIGDTSLALRLVQVPKQYLVGFDAPAEAALTALAAGLAAVGLLFLAVHADAPGRRGGATAALLGLAGVAMPAALAVLGVDHLNTRNVIGALVPVLVALAAGFAVRTPRRAGTAAATALCVVSALVVVWVAADPTFRRADWRGAAEALGPASHDRAIVITPEVGIIPMRLYLDGASSLTPGTRVTEVHVLGLARRHFGEAPDPPRTTPPPPAPTLTQVGRVEAPTYTLVRYRAAAPVALTDAGIAAGRLAPEPAGVLFQPAKR